MDDINYFGWFLFSIWLFFAYFVKVRIDYYFEEKKEEISKRKPSPPRVSMRKLDSYRSRTINPQ